MTPITKTAASGLIGQTGKILSLLKGIFFTGIIFISLCPMYVSGEITEPGTEQSQAVQVIDCLHDALIHVMQNSGSLRFEGRYNELEPVITSKFNTPLISRVILSRYWENLDKEQKLEFIELYNRLITATYASRFDGYDGHEFRYVTTEPLNRGRLLVRTELAIPGDEPVKLDYLMNQKDDNWMIISVIANGANDLSIRRGEYADVIKLRGYDALLKEIRGQIRDMENES